MELSDNKEKIAYQGTNGITESQENGRSAIRFIRDDIKVALTHFNIFNLDKKVYIRLLDISSNGVLIASDLKFAQNKKMRLIIQFKDRKRYILPVTVVRKICSQSGAYQYGLKFRKAHESLGDYLLKTQTKLIFK